MLLTVEPSSAEDVAAGIAARFEYRSKRQAITLRGVARRSRRGLTIASLEVIPDNGDVTGSLLRGLSTGELLLQIRAAVQPAPAPAATSGSPQCPCVKRRGGWPPITDGLLREVALAYLDETAAGTAPGVLDRLSQRFGRPEGTIRGWLKRARGDGWLGPVVQGRAGCEPGPRLLTEPQEASAA